MVSWVPPDGAASSVISPIRRQMVSLDSQAVLSLEEKGVRPQKRLASASGRPLPVKTTQHQTCQGPN